MSAPRGRKGYVTYPPLRPLPEEEYVSAPRGWSRVEAGHYYTRRYNHQTRQVDQIHAFIYTTRPGKPDWKLKINGEHRAYGGTLRSLKNEVERIYARN